MVGFGNPINRIIFLIEVKSLGVDVLSMISFSNESSFRTVLTGATGDRIVVAASLVVVAFV